MRGERGGEKGRERKGKILFIMARILHARRTLEVLNTK